MTAPGAAHRTSPPAQPVAEEDLAAFREAAPSNTEGHSQPLEEPHFFTEDALRRMVIDAVTGRMSVLRTPEERALRAKIQAEVEEILARPGAVGVEISSDIPGGKGPQGEDVTA
jgi:hypothetical protein